MKQKCKILVLSDIDSSTAKIIKNSVNLAKIVDGEINFFCVKKATDIVEKESQLSAMRTINEKFLEADNKIKKIIEEQSKNEDVKIDYKISFGNLKNEISNQIKETNPDMIVLGKSKSKVLSFIGDNIINHVLKEYSGTVMITSENNLLEANSDISLGLLDNVNTFSSKFAETIVSYSDKSLTSFSINDDKLVANNIDDSSKKIVEFVFEKGDNVIENISNYLSKSKVNLLFIHREKQEIKSNIKKIIKNLDCSLILTT
jgi:nucleotide-binding universal stress UspA family protein